MNRTDALPKQAIATLCFALLAAAAPRFAHAEPLGRLFLTPEQRAALERQRHQKTAPKPQPVEPEPETGSLSLNGIVTRSDGKATIWVNGAPYYDAASAGELLALPAGGEDGAAASERREPRRPSVKVGESLNRATGKKADRLRGGQVSVGRPGSEGQ